MEDIENIIKTVYEQTELKWKEIRQYIANTNLDGGKYSIFYNDPYHTLRKGDIYLVGLNPGGDPTKTNFETEDAIITFKHFKNAFGYNYSAYLDECWGNSASELQKGKALHQLRVVDLIGHVSKYLGAFRSVRDVFAANLIFFRTKGKNELTELLEKAKKAQILDYCWKWHVRFLEVVRPKIILCNGNAHRLSSYSYVKRFLDSETTKKENTRQFGKKSIKYFEAAIQPHEKSLIIGIPHLSYPSLSERNGGYGVLETIINEFIE